MAIQKFLVALRRVSAGIIRAVATALLRMLPSATPSDEEVQRARERLQQPPTRPESRGILH